MRIKLLKENFLHNKVISLLILLLCSLTMCVSLLSFEIPRFLTYANIESMHYNNNDFDISIKANTILSTKGVYDSLNDEYKDELDRVVSFYDCALPIKIDDKEMFVQVYEADSTDYQIAFSLDVIPLNNEVVLTKEVSDALNININDNISIPIKDQVYIYQVVDIIEGTGLIDGSYALVGGKNISYCYSGINYKFSNHILIDLKDDDKVKEVYPIIKNRYSEYNVTNILDEELASTMTTDIMKIICIVASMLFIVVAILICGIYNYRLKKQLLFFDINSQANYYKSVKFIWWLALFIISTIFGSVFANLILDVFKPIYYCKTPYVIGGLSYLKSFLMLMIMPLALALKGLPIKISKKCIRLILLIICALLCVGMLLVKTEHYLTVLKVLLVVIVVTLLIDLLLYLLKFLKPSLLRTYIYNINSKNNFLKNNMLIQIMMIIVCTVILSSASYYKVTVGDLSKFLEIDEVVATTSKYVNTDKYDLIKMGNNGQLDRMYLSIMLGLNSDQVDEYTNIEMTTDEKLVYQSRKSVILSKYHQNVSDLDVGDIVSIRIGEHTEEFYVVKFINYPTANVAIMSDSDYLYNGYIVNDNISAEELAKDFQSNNYFIINFKTTLDKVVSLYMKSVDVTIAVFIGLVIFIVFFSIYLFYLDFLYQKENIKKLKTFGLSYDRWLKLNIIKNTLVLLICLVFGSILNYYVTRDFDLILRTIHTISYVGYDLKFAMISLSLVVTNVIVGFVYTNYEYKKI